MVLQAVYRVDDFAEHVGLSLLPRRVADAHRAAALVSRQVVEGVLGEDAAAVDGVHDLRRVVLEQTHGVGDQRQEPVGFVGARGDPQRLHREAEITQPHEPVVPVRVAADDLGQ